VEAMPKIFAILMNRFIPFILLLVIHGMAFKPISSDTLKTWMEIGTKFDFILIDVRSTVSTIIANEKCLPYHIPLNDGKLENQIQKVPKSIVLVLYCKTGRTSDKAAALLEKSTYKVFSLTGGISKWNGATKPANSALPLSALPKISRKVNSDFGQYRSIDNDTLKSWITEGAGFDFILIDIRNEKELTSVIANDSCRPYNFSWNEGDLQSNMIKLPKEIPVVLYCRSGNRSSNASAFMGKAGFTVFNLTGGIILWNGSTKPGSAVRLSTDLPAPSMAANLEKKSAFLISERLFSGMISVVGLEGWLRVSWPEKFLDSPINEVEILSASGKSCSYGLLQAGEHSVVLPSFGSGIHYILLKHDNNILAVKPAMLPPGAYRPLDK
jgi:rhodanese-related sulfurtransferase